MHYSNSEGLLASPASSVPALQHFAIFDSSSWFGPVVAPMESGCMSAISRRLFAVPAFGVAPVFGAFFGRSGGEPAEQPKSKLAGCSLGNHVRGGAKWPRSSKIGASARGIAGC
jgi:hypothetical protein